MLINKFLTSAFVLVNGIVFNRSNGLIIKRSKRSKVPCRNNIFQESYYVKYFKEIKRLKSLQKQKAEVYLEPKQASMMELFCEYV